MVQFLLPQSYPMMYPLYYVIYSTTTNWRSALKKKFSARNRLDLVASGELTAKAETGEFLVSDRSINGISPQKKNKKKSSYKHSFLICSNSDPPIRSIYFHPALTFFFLKFREIDQSLIRHRRLLVFTLRPKRLDIIPLLTSRRGGSFLRPKSPPVVVRAHRWKYLLFKLFPKSLTVQKSKWFFARKVRNLWLECCGLCILWLLPSV